MIEVRVSDARRDLSEHINRVAYGNERIVFTRHGKGVVALVPIADAELLQRLEDEADMAILRERLADDDVSGYVPHAQVAADLNAEGGTKASGSR